MTLQDVADRAGVSITTASRVVNDGTRRVGAQLAQRVHRAAAELGYTANLQARAVATGRSSMVGVVVHDIADPYFSSIAAGLIEMASRSSCWSACRAPAADEAAEREYVSLMRAQRARAVILVGSRTDDAAERAALAGEIAAFTRQGGRAVCVGQPLLGVDTIAPENAAGADALARALAALGPPPVRRACRAARDRSPCRTGSRASAPGSPPGPSALTRRGSCTRRSAGTADTRR